MIVAEAASEDKRGNEIRGQALWEPESEKEGSGHKLEARRHARERPCGPLFNISSQSAGRMKP